jgi:aspartate/methionine/tyrosine aminotransferase
MEIGPFEIERFYERWEFTAELMLSSSDCESRALAELLALEPDAGERLRALRLGYTEVPGSAELREAIATLHERCGPDDVLALAAAEEGIFIAYHALLRAGDHVVVEAPCYGSAIELARSTGAEVSLWQRRPEDGWEHDLQELERLIEPRTKLIYVNSPHNPTGTQMAGTTFERVIELAREHDAVLFSDEVYRGLEHDETDRLPAACDVYERAISLNTVSKAYGLPGLRVGWVVCRDHDLLRQMRELKLYTTICSSAPSELLVALALRHGRQIVADSRGLIAENLPLIDGLIERRAETFSWIRPSAGPIGFARVSGIADVTAWCERIATDAGVLLLPGSVYGEPEHVRLGYGRANAAEAIERLESYLGSS